MFVRIAIGILFLIIASNAFLLYEQNNKLRKALDTRSEQVAAQKNDSESSKGSEEKQKPSYRRDAYSEEDIGNYVLSATTGSAVAHISGLAIVIEKERLRTGSVPQYLSDVGILYPQANSPDSITQTRLLNDGSIAAKLSTKNNHWLVLRRTTAGSYGDFEWECQVNFALPHGPEACDRTEINLRPVSAGFDCAQASTEVENFICQRDRLMTADYELNKAWKKLQGTHPEAIQPESQQRWLNQRNKRCPPESNDRVQCLDDLMRKRTRQFERLISMKYPD